MNKVTELKRTVRKRIPAQRIMVSLMPDDVKEQLINAAIVISILYGDGEIELPNNVNSRVSDAFESLEHAANIASQYTIPIEIEVDEPV